MTSSLSVNSTVPQIPNLTVQLPRTMASANVKPLAHQPDVHTGHDLGELSAWFESARSAAGAIGYDLHGG
jgi:malonyl CoA-acyl carrier protein transacylase